MRIVFWQLIFAKKRVMDNGNKESKDKENNQNDFEDLNAFINKKKIENKALKKIIERLNSKELIQTQKQKNKKI